jgi:hypothetical protein
MACTKKGACYFIAQSVILLLLFARKLRVYLAVHVKRVAGRRQVLAGRAVRENYDV